MTERIEDEYNRIIEEARKQPGIVELMRVYNDYDEYLAKMQAYLNWLHTQKSYFLSDRTEQSDKWERGISTTCRQG